MPSPIITVSKMREWESATWNVGVTESSVIERVGCLVAERLRMELRPGDRVLLLAGRGNNGNDVRCMRPHLDDFHTRWVDVPDPGAALDELKPFLAAPVDWIVDGLFGIGLNRPLDGAWRRLIDFINQAGARILAVDAPSGLNVESGGIEGCAIRADLTLTLGAVKAGLLSPAAVEYCGRLELIPDIGLVTDFSLAGNSQWILPADFPGLPPTRNVTGHKGSYGHLGIWAGSPGYHGAAVLACRAAQKARPGLITLQTHAAVYVPVAAQLQAAMVRPWTEDDPVTGEYSALVIGPGLAAPGLPETLVAEVRKLWRESPIPLVVDASALDWLPAGGIPNRAVRIITPHPGEAARLLGTGPADVQSDRLGATRALSEKFGGCHVVLKGHQSVIGSAAGSFLVNSSGNPGLAQGGSGDVLAGFLGGLLAQPELARDPERAVAFAVWQHGHTADRLEARSKGWTPEDLVAGLAE